MNIVFEKPSETKFVVSPNAPVRQIWISAMARSYKLSWSADAGAFMLDSETLPQLPGLQIGARYEAGADECQGQVGKRSEVARSSQRSLSENDRYKLFIKEPD